MRNTHRFVLYIRKPNGDREFRAFPFAPDVEGSRETAAERMELFRLSLPRGFHTACSPEMECERELVEAY